MSNSLLLMVNNKVKYANKKNQCPLRIIKKIFAFFFLVFLPKPQDEKQEKMTKVDFFFTPMNKII